MMYKTKSNKNQKLYSLTVLPLVCLLFIASSCMKNADEVRDNQRSEKAVADIPDKMPEYPGGQEALIQFLSNEIKYPESLKELELEGKVIVEFTIGADGVVRDPEIIRGAHELMNQEALRVVSNMQSWSPGMQGRTPVETKMKLPILFQFQ